MARDLSELTLTRKVIRQEIVSRTSRNPLTLTSTGVGALMLAGGIFTSVGMWIAIVGGLLVPAGFLFNYVFRAAQYSREFVDEVAKSLDRRRQRREGEIRADLYDLANDLAANDEAGDLASTALDQFGYIHDKFDLFLTVLDRKLHPGELAHARYLGAADQFFMKVMEHLGSTAEALQVVSVAAGDEHRNDQLQQIKGLLSQNSEALAAFDATITALSSMRDLDASGGEDLQLVKAQLEKLADQVEQLGNT